MRAAIEGVIGAALLFASPFELHDAWTAAGERSFPVGIVMVLLFGGTLVVDAVRLKRRLREPAASSSSAKAEEKITGAAI